MCYSPQGYALEIMVIIINNLLWCPLGQMSSECSKVPLGPLLFALALQKMVSSLAADDERVDLLQAWYLEDEALAGSHPAVLVPCTSM